MLRRHPILVPLGLLGAVATIIGLCLDYAQVRPLDKDPRLLTLAGAAVFFVSVAILVARLEAASKAPRAAAPVVRVVSTSRPALDLNAKRFSGITLRLTDLLPLGKAKIEDREFVDCRIFGPAVLVPEASKILECTWHGEPNTVFIEVLKRQEKAIGPIGVVRCTFLACTFSGVAVMASAEVIAQWKQSAGLGRSGKGEEGKA